MKIHYNKNLKELARKLRNNSTRSEVLLWYHIKGKQMMGYDFHRQKPIDRFIVDFFCNTLRLAIELDGYSHDFEDVYEKDINKEKRLNELGIKVLRFDDREVIQNMDNVLRVIEGFIEEFEKDTPPTPLDRGEEIKKYTVT